MTPIHVVGIGLAGAASLDPAVRSIVEQAAILAGGDRHRSYFPDHRAERWPLKDLENRLLTHLQQPDPARVVVLTSGDPLFFGLGRQLLQRLPATALTFHPHVSSVQLAFSRLKLPWQDAALVSVHGRSLMGLVAPLKAGTDTLAVLTDPVHTPAAIARFVQDLALPSVYRLWVCENLGGATERVQCFDLEAAATATFAPLNVVVLQRHLELPNWDALPLLGLPDALFASFRDRPGLMTKREIRVQILSELALQPGQVIWDVGAGTGSVSVEVARLVPDGQIWAIEQSTAGHELIQQNIRRFGTHNVQAIQGQAPTSLTALPAPHRIFIGGSQGLLTAILDQGAERLLPAGRMVAAIATLENQAAMTQWLAQHPGWQGQWQQVAIAHSAAVGALTRWLPQNPVTLVTLTRRSPVGADSGSPTR